MTAISSKGQAANGGSSAGCPLPFLALFVSAAVWLVIASLLGLVANLKFHNPNILGNVEWLTYGRIHPAAFNCLIYGFAVQAGLAVALWLLCDLGGVELAQPVLVLAGGKIWNIGVLAGVIGILYGDSTGFEWFEMPRYGTMTMFFGYALIAIACLTAFHRRRERRMHVSQWFLMGAIFWFPWIFITAEGLLIVKPVQGIMQPVVAWWYANNLSTVFFGFVGLAALFYFIPKLAGQALYSASTAIFIFWALIFFGSWGGFPPGSPLPAWMIAVSTMAAMLTIVPTLAVGVNIFYTKGDCSKLTSSPIFPFLAFGTLSYIVSGLVKSLAATDHFASLAEFTWFTPAQVQLSVFGFMGLVMLGAAYYIVPQITGISISSGAIKANAWIAIIGVLLQVLPLAIGGLVEGAQLKDAHAPFFDAVKASLMAFRVSSLGDVLVLIASLMFLFNLLGVLRAMARNFVGSFLAANAQTAGVAS